jgi:glycosyltransferase involved in cell wall biosynthesis
MAAAGSTVCAVRIAQVVPRGEQPWSGVLTVIVHLSAALAKLGEQVEVWQLHDWAPDSYADQRGLLESAGVRQLPVGISTPLRRVGPVVAALAEERSVDVVHLHGAFNPSNTAISRALRRPYVFSPHSGYDPVSLRRSRIRKFLYRLAFERAMLDRAALLVALTEVELTQLRQFPARGQAVVIPNGVTAAPDDVDPHAFRDEIGVPASAPLALFVGRLDVHRKGLDLLVQGLAAAPQWHLAAVGPRFRDVPRLERMIEELAVADRVHLAGERHGRALHEALAGADVFALMSRWEGLPMALLEALSFGKPAVVSGAVERLVGVEAGGAGWVAEGDDLGSLLRRLQKDGRRALLHRGEAARLLAKGYDWNAVAHRYQQAYEQARRSMEPVRP